MSLPIIKQKSIQRRFFWSKLTLRIRRTPDRRTIKYKAYCKQKRVRTKFSPLFRRKFNLIQRMTFTGNGDLLACRKKGNRDLFPLP